LDVAARNSAEQDQLDKLVIGQRLVASLQEALAQPLPMAVIMRRLFVHENSGGRSSPAGDSVNTSTPVSVTATVCSNWALSERSRVTAVQPSESTFTAAPPRLIIGSMVKNMPALSGAPSPRLPACRMLGSSWNS